MDTLRAQSILLRISLFGAIAFLPGIASAQDGHQHHSRAQPHQHAQGHHGHGHAQWHESFYQKLQIPGSKTSCCNLSDCRPTEVRSNGDHYEIRKDGRWIRVQQEKIVKVTAPDGGAHICAPDSNGGRFDPDYVFCIVMPLES